MENKVIPKVNTASVKLKPGLTMFQMQASNGEIKAARVKVLTHLKGYVKVIVEDGFLYVPALNPKNAKRKFKNNVEQLLKNI